MFLKMLTAQCMLGYASEGEQSEDPHHACEKGDLPLGL